MKRRFARAALAATGVIAVAGGCSHGDPTPTAGPICTVTRVARERILEPEGLTFQSLVRQRRRTESNAAVAALVGLTHDAGDRDLGPYGPVIDYLDDRNTAWTPEFRGRVTVPKRTEAVVASARELDRDLADGMCD